MAGAHQDSVVKIIFVVALYWFISIAMVFLNRHLLSGVKLDAPLFVTWFQCVVAVAACYMLGSMNTMSDLMKSFPKFQYDLNVAKKVLPLSLVFVGMIAFNNLCLMYVGVAFYNVGRSLTTVVNVILSWVVLRQGTSGRALAMCGVIVAGFYVGVDQEKSDTDISYLGVFYGVLASACTALNAIYIKKILPEVDNDMWKLTAYNNMNAIILFVPLMLVFGEVGAVVGSEEVYSITYWFLMVVAGIFGIAIGLVTMWQIDVTSPLTHNISGTAKACAQTILALQLSGESKSFMWWMSNVMVLGGSLGYSLVKLQEMKQAKSSPLPVSK